MSKEKILFLDLDGPMIPYRCMFLPGQTVPWSVFDPVAVSMINQLCSEHGWRIVLHTSWVKVFGGQKTKNHCVQQGILAEHFHKDAWTDEHIHWRYTRVAKWLFDHPDVKNYVILDDDEYEDDIYADWKHPEGMAKRLVKINYYTGMMFMDYNNILAVGKTDADGYQEVENGT